MDEPRERKDHPLPESVSDQNAEEAEPGHDGGDEGGTRRRPGEAGGGDRSSGGEAGEGSQSTGHPDSAG